MAWVKQFTCDVCGKQKGSVNHWWIGYASNGCGYMVSQWQESLASNEEVASLCGQECAVKKLSEYMQISGGK